MFVEILLNQPTQEQTYHYTLPSDWQPLQVGQLVVVPWGRQRLQGVVLAVSTQPPADLNVAFKPVADVLSSQAVLTAAQITLLHWLSQTYSAPRGACLSLFLPPGFSKQGDQHYRLRQPQHPPKNQSESQLLAVLQAEPQGLNSRQLEKRLPRRNWQPILRHLVGSGVLEQQPVLAAPSVQIKTETTIQPSALLRQSSTWREHFPRKWPANQRVVQFLADHWPAEPALPDLAHFLSLSPDQITAVLATDLVELVPEQAVYQRYVGSTVWQRWYQRLPEPNAAQTALYHAFEQHPVWTTDALPNAAISALPGACAQDLLTHSVNPARLRLKSTLLVARQWLASQQHDPLAWQVLAWLLTQPHQPQPWSALRAVFPTCTLAELRRWAVAGWLLLETQEQIRDPLAKPQFSELPRQAAPPLLPAQRAAWQAIAAAFEQPKPLPFLLHGVTGSGKTELYLQAAALTVQRGKQVLLLVPEIALTAQLVRLFLARFGAQVAILHSNMSEGERFDTWRRVHNGSIAIVVGARSALFLPFACLGLLVVDEEHAESYQQDSTAYHPPYYNARTTALAYAQQVGAVCILGTATPDLNTYHAAQRAQLQLLALPARVNGKPPPPIELIDLRQELRAGNHSLFSRTLQQALQETLTSGQQSILYLNRRGQASYVFCRDCGQVLQCPRCHMPYVYHAIGEQLRCHHCNTRRKSPKTCSRCGSVRIKYFGAGTERVVEAVQTLLPNARVLRWDADSIPDSTQAADILAQLRDRTADILVGTQMVAKGLDLPAVTLVGVVLADVGLNLPDYRAGERVFQTLLQVAGRAGRAEAPGRVIVQTYQPEHPILQAVQAQSYADFYHQELARRSQLGYPPFGHLVRLLGRQQGAEALLIQTAEALATQIRQNISTRQANSTQLIGPVPCFFSPLAGWIRWQLVLRGPNPQDLMPEKLPEGWVAEIDPLSLL